MRRLYSAVILLIVAALFGCGGSHSASLTPQSSLNGAVPASASRSALGGTLGTADVAAALPPASPIKVSPYAVALVTAGQAQTITVSEPGYSGKFTATSSDTAIATVSTGHTPADQSLNSPYLELVGTKDQEIVAAMAYAAQRLGNDEIIIHVGGQHTLNH